MNEVVGVSSEEASKELLKNMNVNISLEGWPCAIAIVGLGIVYVIATKIKCDFQRSTIDSRVGRLYKVA